MHCFKLEASLSKDSVDSSDPLESRSKVEDLVASQLKYWERLKCNSPTEIIRLASKLRTEAYEQVGKIKERYGNGDLGLINFCNDRVSYYLSRPEQVDNEITNQEIANNWSTHARLIV